MPSIHPVLLVGTGDVSDLRDALRALGCGTMLAPSVDQACLMLRHFRVDALVTLSSPAEDLRALGKVRTPLVVVSADPMMVTDVKWAASISERLTGSEMARIVMRVINGERGIREDEEPASGRVAASA